MANTVRAITYQECIDKLGASKAAEVWVEINRITGAGIVAPTPQSGIDITGLAANLRSEVEALHPAKKTKTNEKEGDN